MAYIKSHSNYVLKKRHQSTNDGTIYERDITTIGGRDNFAPGQVPLYRSGNFVITVNNDNDVVKSVQNSSWAKNTSGDVWTLDTLENYDIDDKSSEDTSIELKKNYYDLRDFAYFGSCAELIRASISDILAKFPGELYVPYDGTVVSSVTYNDTVYDDSGNTIESAVTIDVSNPNDIPHGAKLNGTTQILGVPVYYYDYTDYNGGSEIDTNFDESGNSLTKIYRLGGEDFYLVDNPFNINIYTDRMSQDSITDENFLKYFANEGYLNYEAIDTSGNSYDISVISAINAEWLKQKYVIGVSDVEKETTGIDAYDLSKYKVLERKPGPCIGRLYCDTAIYIIGTYNRRTKKNDVFHIYTYVSNDNKLVYLINLKEQLENGFVDLNKKEFKYRIRPKQKFIDKFFLELDNFEKILLNRKSSPKYTATFNVINDDEYGEFSNFEKFTFPTSYGGYNLGSYGSSYDDYVSKLANIAEYYDMHFSDNMYRSMTHESIKNFDWSYEKYNNGEDEEDITESANKIAKVIRLFGREYDELLSYINNITTYNIVTYNNVNNLPDYFLSDSLNEKGWDIEQVIPLKLYEYIGDNINDEYTETGSARTEDEKSNVVNGLHLHRIFDQDTSFKVKPYSKEFDVDGNGYFYGCTCSKSGTTYEKISGNVTTTDTYIDCSDTLRTRIKNYSSENEWTMPEVNNSFMKRLYINSEDIWRHKGTQDGVEMILGMFGMKSKRWYDALPTYEKDTYSNQFNDETFKPYDFEIKEYTSFTKGIEDPYISSLNDYKYDWVNKAKEISYGNDDYENYQGLPVTYTEDKVNHQRFLYPDFEKSKQYDGDLYYQMNGGWLDTYPYLFDKDNNLVINNGENHVFEETVRNIRSVDTLQDLFDIPVQDISNGDIVGVNDLSGTYAIVDGVVYDIITETDGNETYRYFTVTPQDGTVAIGNAYFDDYIIVSDPFTVDKKRRYIISDNSYDNTDIKIYLIRTKESSGEIIYSYSENSSVSTFTVFENGKYMEGDNYTNFFRINDINSSREVSLMGWEQLRDTDNDYYKINSNNDYFFGNNPHTGHYHYDNGHEYFTYFRHLFRYATDNSLFNDAALSDYTASINGYSNLYDDIYDFGFKGMIDDNACNINYDSYLTEDSKIHYFGNFFSGRTEDNEDEGVFKGEVVDFVYSGDISTFNENLPVDSETETHFYNLLDIDPSSVGVNFMSSNNQKGYGWMYDFSNGNSDNSIVSRPTDIDGVTNQIMNTKVIKIIFYIRDDNFYSKTALEEVKYLQSVVVPYMAQMIPSGAILKADYIYRNETVITYTAKTMDKNRNLIDGIPVMFGNNEYSGYTEQGLITYTKR